MQDKPFSGWVYFKQVVRQCANWWQAYVEEIIIVGVQGTVGRSSIILTFMLL